MQNLYSCSHFKLLVVSFGTILFEIVPATSYALEMELDRASVGEHHTSSYARELDKGFPWREPVSGPLCGIYAACSALQLLGAKVAPEDFLSTMYVGTCGGSNQREIVAVIEDSNYDACALSNLSIYDLRVVGLPLVSFVRSKAIDDRYNHWVTVIAKNDGVVVYDGAKEPYEITVAEFLGIWSGVGVFANQRGSLSPVLLIGLARAPLFLCCSVLVYAAYRVSKSWENTSGMSPSIAVLALSTLLLCVVGNILFGDLRNCEVGISTAVAPFQTTVRETSLTEAVAESAVPTVLLVDARRQIDYEMGSIRRAVNIPISASFHDVKSFLQNVNRNVKVYVYCQSKYCAYDDAIAKQIAFLGFKNVAVCDEGWVEYNESIVDPPSSE